MQIIETKNAPAAIGPYSQAISANGFVFCSGQIALTANGQLVDGGVTEQTVQVMENLKQVLNTANSDFSKVVKTTIFLADMNDFASVNEIYGRYFNETHKPARATVEVSRLPKDVKVEISCIAITS